ncbi:MAG: AmmeMemoRadiSam system protein A [Sphaerochaeta sp.]|nr:AmmeMemoRadiSam system protein A [Sphaerochaeta sp.]
MQHVVQKELLALAREAITSTLLHGQMPLYEKLKAANERPYNLEMGCFVTLKTKEGNLRGCIGNLWGKGPLFQEIPSLARQAAFSDPRFHPVNKDELDHLVIEISLLSSMQSIDDWTAIRVGIDGVLLTHGYHRAVFLPQVASEQGWDLPTMLSNLSLKAGLYPQAYLDRACSFEVFQAEVFGEEPL